MGLIVRVAPLGVLGAVAYTVGQYGVGSLKQLVSLVRCSTSRWRSSSSSCSAAVLRVAGLNIFRFLAYLREELTIVLATASSDAVLPQIMRKLERMGVKESVVGLVIPTGYSFNLDAFSIYLTLAVVFIAQATNTPLSLGDLLLVLAVSLVTSRARTACRGRRSSFCGDAQCGAGDSGDRARAGAVGRLVHRHGARARQPDRQLRRHRRRRRLGARSRPATAKRVLDGEVRSTLRRDSALHSSLRANGAARSRVSDDKLREAIQRSMEAAPGLPRR